MVVDGVWLAAGGPLVAFALAWLITGRYALRTEREMRDFVYGALGRYVSPDIADQVFRNVALMRPQRREVTLCYADLEGFRRMDELLPPDVLVELLNTYFGELTSLVRQTGGHVEYSGDALIAFWGAPVRLDRHGPVACRTALSIQSEVARPPPRVGAPLRGRGPDADRAPLGRGGRRRHGQPAQVQLHRRRSAGGDRGAAGARQPPVGTELLASGETVRRVGTEFVFRELDTVTLGSGVETLYQLVSRRGEVPPALVPILEGWPEALARARRRDFTGALGFFEAHAAVDPVSAAWAERVRGYIAHPPPQGWTGRGDLRGGG